MSNEEYIITTALVFLGACLGCVVGHLMLSRYLKGGSK